MLQIPFRLDPKYGRERCQPLKLFLLQADLINQEVDAIVNPTDEVLSGGGGLDAIIHRAAGPKLREACDKLQNCDTGDTKITPGFELAAQYYISRLRRKWPGLTTRNQIYSLGARKI